MVRNEATYLAEWIAYQAVIGFDRIIVYDNESTDLTRKLLTHLATLGYVDYHPWPDQPGVNRQVSAYENAIRRYRQSVDWIAFFDIDEFPVLHLDQNVGALLRHYEDFDGLAINWKIFGSSGLKKRHKGLVIERFERCAEPNANPNRCIKVIVKPRNIRRCNVHVCYPRVSTIVDENANDVMKTLLQDGIHTMVSHNRVQLNHYILRSREEWLQKKARGRGAKAPEDQQGRSPEYFSHHDRNEHVDSTALRYVPQVRARLKLMGEELRRAGFEAEWDELASYF